MDMNGINEILGAVDEEIEKDEFDEAKEELKAKRRKYYFKYNALQKLWQDARCLVGKHMFNQVPSMGITTCPACTRIWNGMKGEK